jgi:hypothetical protein
MIIRWDCDEIVRRCHSQRRWRLARPGWNGVEA